MSITSNRFSHPELQVIEASANVFAELDQQFGDTSTPVPTVSKAISDYITRQANLGSDMKVKGLSSEKIDGN